MTQYFVTLFSNGDKTTVRVDEPNLQKINTQFEARQVISFDALHNRRGCGDTIVAHKFSTNHVNRLRIEPVADEGVQ